MDDVAEIVDLTYRYSEALDKRDWQLMRAVLTDDVRMDWVDEGHLNVGLDTYVSAASGAMGAIDASHHMVTNHRIDVDGDAAQGYCYLQATLIKHDAPGGAICTRGAIYEDRYRRVDGVWKIAARTFRLVWMQGNPGIMGRAVEGGAEMKAADGVA